MAGKEEVEPQEMQNNECLFKWDEESQLYFHASSGFYHDPNAGWYYSSKDGLYYKFENGSYVLLETDKEEEYEAPQQRAMVSDEPIQDEPCDTDCVNSDEPENPPPPSEWLEETLIDLYLSGYSNPAINAADDLVMPSETDVEYNSKSLVHGAVNDDAYELEEGEWVPEDFQDVTESSGRGSDEGTSQDEENWRAQYGQVMQSSEEGIPASHIVDLWDWAMVTETVEKKKRGKRKKHQVIRLVGKLVRPSTKLHPSVPSGGRLLKTAAVCEVHLALVRVSSGQVYRLRSPSLKYLASLSTYDSSDPTKDWGFPGLSVDKQGMDLSNLSGSCEYGTSDGVPAWEDSSAFPNQLTVLEKNKGCTYRDRAAERRALHGGFGVGPGQKNLGINVGPSSPVSSCTEEAAAEALNLSFGAGSFARRILESMGWKEGEALGNTTKGLIEPLQVVGNKGYAGLGWDRQTSSPLKRAL